MTGFSFLDLLALGWFIAAWLGFTLIVDRSAFGRPSLSRLMDDHRRLWMEVMRHREVRIVDTAIMTSLQNGTAFFASTSLIALGGALTLLNQTDRMVEIFLDLPLHVTASRSALEVKVVGLVAIYGYAFFKFGWSYRLFNYSAILIGAVPTAGAADTAAAKAAVDRAAAMQIDAGHHFHWGLRALFFSIGFFGWFVDARVFLASTTVIFAVLLRRQYFSKARTALSEAVAASEAAAADQGAGNSAEERPVSR